DRARLASAHGSRARDREARPGAWLPVRARSPVRRDLASVGVVRPYRGRSRLEGALGHEAHQARGLGSDLRSFPRAGAKALRPAHRALHALPAARRADLPLDRPTVALELVLAQEAFEQR